MMKKYKALVFREWKITKKFYMFRSMLFLAFVAMFCATFYALGRLNGIKGEGAYIAALVMSSIMCVFAGVLVAEDNGEYKSDVNSGWLNFSWALPLTSWEKAVSKYLFRVMVILVGMLLTLLSITGLCAVFGCPTPLSTIYVFFWSINVVLLIDLIRQFVIMHAVDTKSLKKIYSIGTILFLAWGFLPIDIFPGGNLGAKMEAFFASLETMGKEEVSLLMIKVIKDIFTISHLWGCIGIGLTIVLLIVSVLMVKRSYERRKV